MITGIVEMIVGVTVEGIVVGTGNIRVRGNMQHHARITGGMRRVGRGKNPGNLGLMVGTDECKSKVQIEEKYWVSVVYLMQMQVVTEV